MKNLLVPFISLLLLAGCSKSEPEKITEVPKQAPPPVHVATMEEWTKALLSTYKESHVKDLGNGVTEFMAKFGEKEDKNFAVVYGERDGFRKLRIYKAGFPMNIQTGVKMYVSVLDGKKPSLFLSSYYWGRSWVFMNKLSILVDGELLFERDFDIGTVNREVEGVGVAERYDLMATDQEIEALRKIGPESVVLVRLTGDKGYVNLKGKNNQKDINAIAEFQRDIVSALIIYDTFNKALEGHLPPDTSAKGK